MGVKFKILGGLALCMGSVAIAGAQEPTGYLNDYCVKVEPGKGAEYRAFLRDVSSKMGQVWVDSGLLSTWAVGRAIAPVGESARCDYHIYVGTEGFPPEALAPEQVEAGMKKAGLTMSRQQMLEKRRSLTRFIGRDLWQGQARVGLVEQGSYVRLNFYKAAPGTLGDWIELESNGWKKLVEEASKETPGLAWGAMTLVMPGGTSLPYNAITYDSFPSWEAYGKGIPARALWNKAHPDTDMAAYLTRVNAVVERPIIDVVKMEHVIRKP